MKQTLKKSVLILGFLFMFVIFSPLPFMSTIAIASASEYSPVQSDIKLNVKSKAIVKDSKYALKIYNMTDSQKAFFKSNATTVATVDEKGEITAVDFGTATITVTIKDGSKVVTTLECEVTVGPPALSVKLTRSEITLTVGRKTTLTAILKPVNTVEEAKFSSNDSSIATVSVGGTVTARAVGVTYIFASIDNGKYDLCKVTVVEESADMSSNIGDSN